MFSGRSCPSWFLVEKPCSSYLAFLSCLDPDNSHLRMKLLMVLVSLQLLLILLFRAGIELNPGPFPCKFCSAVPETIASNIRHQQLHSVSKNFLYHCPEPLCIFSTKSFNFVNQHVSTFHRDISHVDPDATESLHCVCIIGEIPCVYSTTSLWELVQHLCVHLDSNIDVECPIDKCHFSKSFKKKSTFRVHLSQYHPNWRAEGFPKQSIKEHYYDVDNILPEASEAMHDMQDGVPFCVQENDDLFSDSAILNCIAKFYLQLYGLHTIPYEIIQDICNGLICITEVIHAKMKCVLTQELKKLEISEKQIGMIWHKLSCADLLYSSHHKDKGTGPFLCSDYLRKKYFQEHLDFCPPMEINLNEDDPESKETQEIIPITATLLRLFEDPIICTDIDESFLKQPDVNNMIVSDYTEGQQYISESHPNKEIHIFLYQDTVNAVMNPLGSAKNKHKLLTMYFTLGNLKPHHRAKVESKHPILIMRESVFKSVKAQESLEQVMTELKLLEREGIAYKGEQTKVAVIFMKGDSLGQHLIGGFIECFSAKFFCRFCDIKRDAFKAAPTLLNPPRTKADYYRCALKAEACGKPCKGIKSSSEFNDLQYFHAATHLVPCLAHDLFEGVVSWDLAGIISHLVDEKWFTYKWINRRIKSLKCQGIDSPNKPAFVNKDGLKLGGHAVQNWTLLRLLPFIIDNKIKDVENSAWKMYLLLKTLCEFFTAPSFLKTDLPYIQDVLLPAYFERRSELLDAEKYPLKPKHHFMVHYPGLLLNYGPLIHLWTLPYEQRHKYFKHLLRLSQNFINPEYSCAYRYQIYTSYMTSDKQIFQHVPFNGLKYKKGEVLLLGVDEGKVIAGVIKEIAAAENTLTFVCELHEALFKSSIGVHFLPDPSNRFTTINFNDLKYPVPHPVYFFRGKRSFSIKHKLLP